MERNKRSDFMKSKLIKSIAFILTMLMIFASLASCASTDDIGGGSSDYSDGGSGSENTNNDSNGNENTSDVVAKDGTIVLWANGEYQAKVIRKENAGEFDKEKYAASASSRSLYSVMSSGAALRSSTT